MTGFDDVSLVGNAIHQGRAETRVRNHFGPLRERQVRTTSIGPFSRRLRKLYFVCSRSFSFSIIILSSKSVLSRIT